MTYLENKQLRFENRCFTADGTPVDVVLQNFPGILLKLRLEKLRPLFSGITAGSVVMIESVMDMVFMNKMILAYLSDPKWKPYCTPYLFGGKIGGFSCRSALPFGSAMISMHQNRAGRTTAFVATDSGNP